MNSGQRRVYFLIHFNCLAYEICFIGSWHHVYELVQENASWQNFKTPDKIGKLGLTNMVKYKLVNDDGVSVHNKEYYYGRQVTMQTIHELGGVCGANSKYSSGMAQAFGLPASPGGQPRHCAYIPAVLI